MTKQFSPLDKLKLALNDLACGRVSSIELKFSIDTFVISAGKEKFNVYRETETGRTDYETGEFYHYKYLAYCGDGTVQEFIEALKVEYNKYDLEAMKVITFDDWTPSSVRYK